MAAGTAWLGELIAKPCPTFETINAVPHVLSITKKVIFLARREQKMVLLRLITYIESSTIPILALVQPLV